MRRPVLMITFPSSCSRRSRFGLPTSSLPSGVIVAAFEDDNPQLIGHGGAIYRQLLLVRPGDRARRGLARAGDPGRPAGGLLPAGAPDPLAHPGPPLGAGGDRGAEGGDRVARRLLSLRRPARGRAGGAGAPPR